MLRFAQHDNTLPILGVTFYYVRHGDRPNGIIWFLLVIIASSWYTFGGATHSNIEGKLSI